MTVHYINNQSSVIMFTGGGSRYLTVGDIEKPAENRLLKSGVSLKADIFKISHHGLDTSNQQKFLDAVNPAYAYFTSNRSDSGHYTTGDVWASVTRAGRNSNVMGTGYNGTITYTCKGGDITVRAERNTKKMYMRLIDKKTNRTRKATFTFNKATEIRMKKKILNPDKYYTQQLNADGTVFSGSFVQRGGRYYLEKGGVGAYNTFAEKGGKTYWFDLSGKRYEGGMLSAYGKRYYMNPKGDPCRLCGWRTISGRKYYFNSDGTLKGFRQTIEVPSSAMAELIEDGTPVRYLYTPREAQARVDSSHVGNSIREILGVPRMRRAFAKAMRDCFRWRDDEVTLYRDFGTSFFFRTRSGCPECGGLILHESTRKTPKGTFPEMYYGVHT